MKTVFLMIFILLGQALPVMVEAAEPVRHISTRYGVTYDFTYVNPQYDKSELYIYITDLEYELGMKIQGVKILKKDLEEDLAQLVKTVRVATAEYSEDSKVILILSYDVAQELDRVQYLLEHGIERSFAENERERVSDAKQEALASTFSVDDMSADEEDSLSGRMAKQSHRIIEKVSQMMGGESTQKEEQAQEVTIHSYHLTFNEVFAQTTEGLSNE